MRPTRREMLAVAASSIALAGCASDGPGTDTPADGAGDDGESDGDGTGGDGTADGDGVTVQVRSHGELGDVLVDGEGMTLYMFDSDEQGAGASTCYEGCAGNWPPLTVEGEPTAGDDVEGELTTFERDDGSTHVAIDGWPLYYWANDQEAGDATGQGVNDVWWVLDPSGTPVREAGGTATATATSTETATADPDVQVRSHGEIGDVLVDGEGMTLYMFDSDEQGAGASTCYEGCAGNWPPLTVEEDPVAGPDVSAELTTFERDDGSTQVEIDGWPLYYWANDQEAGDATGQGVNDVWWVLDPSGSPVRGGSETATETESSGDGGSIY